MAYTSLADFNWGSSPKIPLKFEYDRRRSGISMEYRFKISVKPMTSSQGTFGYQIGTTINLNNSTAVSSHLIKDNSPSRWETAYVYETAWFTVSNKTSGTVPLTITITTNAGRGNSSWNYSLTVDPGKSTMTVPTFTIGTNGNFSIARNNSNFTHTITYTFGNASGTITTKTTSTTVSWTPPVSLYRQITGKTSETGTVKLETFSGTTSLGSVSYTLTINAGTVYNQPSIKNLMYERGTKSESTWTAAEDGADVKITFTATISSISGITTTAVVTADGTSLFTGDITSGAKTFYALAVGTDSSSVVNISISDTVGAQKSYLLTVPTLEVLINKNFDLNAIGIGKVAERAKSVEFAAGYALYVAQTLYDGTPTTTYITLSETVSNFRYICIFYQDNDGRCGSKLLAIPQRTIDTNNPLLSELTIVLPRSTETITLKSRGIAVFGTVISTASTHSNYSVDVTGLGSSSAYGSNQTHISIFKVIGWR